MNMYGGCARTVNVVATAGVPRLTPERRDLAVHIVMSRPHVSITALPRLGLTCLKNGIIPGITLLLKHVELRRPW
jgi:hypothetical protein